MHDSTAYWACCRKINIRLKVFGGILEKRGQLLFRRLMVFFATLRLCSINDLERDNMNVRTGLFRLWALLSIVWIGGFGYYVYARQVVAGQVVMTKTLSLIHISEPTRPY